ncbi:hypothetical protein COLO4_07563 [Corchorus olitorius]|uniref:Uncharacterized protein n=1 Tax=Corchorus olitorius TaxID=93759 RepID=A0A1R3KJE4_9ROSI|nr:hypothetical protein COLO4_07563 [Corchorus olitorius]
MSIRYHKTTQLRCFFSRIAPLQCLAAFGDDVCFLQDKRPNIEAFVY